MALQKTKTIKGHEYTDAYHKIVNCDVKKGLVYVSTYSSKEAAQTRNNMLDGRETIKVNFDITALEAEGMNPLKFAYTKVKESKLDEEGNETNWYADAEDC